MPHLSQETEQGMSGRNKDHVLIFPFMAIGHTIPLLHLSSALAHRGLKVTLITTAANSPFLHRYLQLPKPNIHILHLPFPTTDIIPAGCESTDTLPSFDLYFSFHRATNLLQAPFRKVLQHMADSGDLPLCVVSDFFLGWTRPICEDEFNVPRIVFTGMGVFSVAVVKYFAQLESHERDTDGFVVPGFPRRVWIETRNLPTTIQDYDPKDPMFEITVGAIAEEVRSWGSLVNSFASMESDYVSVLDAFYEKGAHAWLVGPLSLHPCGGDSVGDASGSLVLKWLEGKRRESVLYVAFGTQAEVSHEQLDEIAHGLVTSGCDFVWVVRSTTWTPPEDLKGWLESGGKGLLWREMAPQREVLTHDAVGGFVSHCGWNSVLDGICAGQPILALPVIGIAEQGINAKFVVDVLGVGLWGSNSGSCLDSVPVTREEVRRGVRELMEGEEGKKVRKQAKAMEEVARSAVRREGSSWVTLEKLLGQLKDELPP